MRTNLCQSRWYIVLSVSFSLVFQWMQLRFWNAGCEREMIKEGDYGKMWIIDAKRQMIQQSVTPKSKLSFCANTYTSNGVVFKTCSSSSTNNTCKLYLLNNSLAYLMSLIKSAVDESWIVNILWSMSPKDYHKRDYYYTLSFKCLCSIIKRKTFQWNMNTDLHLGRRQNLCMQVR